MQKRTKTNKQSIIALIAMAVIFLANFNNPPNRRTGAPGDTGTCAGCHSGTNPNGYDGSLAIEGFPTSILPGTTYSLTARLSNPNGLANRGGFQAVVLNETSGNVNSGNIIATAGNPSTIFSGGREYVEHSPGKSFPPNNEITWDFDWVAPMSADGSIIKAYSAAVIGNGSGSGGDFVVTTVATGTIMAPPPPCDLAVATDPTNVVCSGECNGMIELFTSGGTAPISYLWSNNETTKDIFNLCPGDYTVTITDANDCEIFAQAQVSEPSPQIITDFDITTESIAGANDGAIDLENEGGTQPYTFLWSNGAITQDIMNLSAGNYCVTINDANDCSFINCYDVAIFECDPINISSVVTGNTCPDDCNGSIDISISGNSSNLTYQWSNGETTEDISGLCDGTYTIEISDEFNCTYSETIILSTANPMVNETTTLDATCFELCNAAISVVTSSGTGPFTYDWNIDDFDGQNQIEDICAGIYDLTVTDGNGCTEFLCFDIDQTDEILMTFATTQACPDSPCNGTVSISTVGGTPPYSYSFDTNGVSFCPGEYGIEVTDALGCTSTGEFIILESPPIEFTLTNTGNDLDGQGNGFFEIQVSGGVPDYSFEWILNSSVVSTDEDPQGLSAGEYNLTITDANGCSLLVEGLFIESTTPSSEPSVFNDLQVFPNPTTNLVHLIFTEQIKESLELTIFDATGKSLPPHLIFSANSLQWEINLQNFPAGVYTLRVKVEGKSSWRKLVKF